MTNTNGSGISLYGANVELVDVEITNCGGSGIFARNTVATTQLQLVATRCEMSNNGACGLSIANFNNNLPHNVCLKNCISHHNSRHGIFVKGKNVLDVHGGATAVHSNGYGIAAYHSAKVIIHLPSHHNTSYNNGNEDRSARLGGTITNVED